LDVSTTLLVHEKIEVKLSNFIESRF